MAVEAALTMPLFVFLILGILQLGLTSQARVMAKYAAYRAARVGALNHADPEAIEAAAILHLMPVLVGNDEVIMPTSSSTDVIAKFNVFAQAGGIGNRLGATGLKQVKTVICGPTQAEFGVGGQRQLARVDQSTLNGRGSSNEVDFDDPFVQSGPDNFYAGASGADALRRFNRMRLRVQVQLLYRMPIPFANMIITKAYLGLQMPSVMMMPQENKDPISRYVPQTYANVKRAHDLGIYVVPINAGYAMRMQSNMFLSRFRPPARNECSHYGQGKQSL
ncbi:TadE/TadG family type IV pilus assembly protein [Hyalangium rubrum]|uniref:TadE/TadG family type IV pilus assembly protein n=1 Tax=Hyalangium rubrum TaxID=3103134 RepID=A0ABU5HCQ3_9BACT|nr:TadE/TadG family type IV pilus assembly protein [Hyalangium sp. s54d21]MDY7231245.1 TadE/TadG family type IV pilus assembly protein [Hyalangium sp. s54d21]